MINSSKLLVVFLMLWESTAFVSNFRTYLPPAVRETDEISVFTSYLDDLNVFKSEKKVLVGLTTDAWQVGQKKYKDFLTVYRMAKRLQKSKLACVDVPMWEVTQGPHYDELQRIFESFWIPDYTSMEHMLLQFDLVVIPDPSLAKYMVESYYEKEAKLEKKRAYYKKLAKQPWGVLETYPPREREEWQRIKSLSKQKWVRKFPPIATVGEDTFNRMRNHGQVEFVAKKTEDFTLYLPESLVPTRRVLVLRYKNRFDTLVHSLTMKGLNVTSAYPLTWMRKEWNAQEERLAKEVDVVYFQEAHAVNEWRDRLGVRDKEVVAVCYDIEVAKLAKQSGFKDVFYAKEQSTEGLFQAVMKATEFAKEYRKTSK